MRPRYRISGLSLGVWLLLCQVVPWSAAQTPSDRAPGAAASAGTEVEAERALGQLLYVPAYSHIYYYNDKRPYLLSVTLSIRNTDMKQGLRLTSVRYFDSSGTLIKEHIEQPVRLGPLGSTEFFVDQRDTAGGAGAKFLVEWQAEKPILTPIVETVMIGASGTHGVSFVAPARVLSTKRS
ncbi:MAG: DUF3124 domain-containing protein [Candidatus Tectimicrobiota bacterium]